MSLKRIEKAANEKVLSTIEMCEVRDYLLVKTTLKTGTRPGALEKTTPQHFNSVRVNQKMGRKVMLIPEHKRGAAGPAMIPMDQDLSKLFKLWIH